MPIISSTLGCCGFVVGTAIRQIHNKSRNGVCATVSKICSQSHTHTQTRSDWWWEDSDIRRNQQRQPIIRLLSLVSASPSPARSLQSCFPFGMPRTLDYWRLTRNTDPLVYFFHLRCYFKRPISSPVRTLACNWYYCAHFIAKPKAACALRFSWVATSSNLGLCASVTSSIKPEVPNVSLRRHRRTEPWPQVTCVKNWWRLDV